MNNKRSTQGQDNKSNIPEINALESDLNRDFGNIDNEDGSQNENIQKENIPSKEISFDNCNLSSDNYKLKLMEKDKIIFEYSKYLKERERDLENTKKLSNSKDETIIQLQDKLKECKFQWKNYEGLLQKKEEEFERYKQFAEDKLLFASQEKQICENKLEDLTKSFEKNQTEYQNTLSEYKQIERQLAKIKVIYEEKDSVIKNYDKILAELKREVKAIPGLKKTISELELTNTEQKNEIKQTNKTTEKLFTEKEELEKAIQRYIEESKQDKEQLKNIFKMTYEIDSLKRETGDKNKEISQQNEKYRSLVKENDSFTHMITSEIGQLTNYLECINFSSKGTLKLQNTIPPKNPTMTSSPSQFSLKYELINKNFNVLKTKILENYNNTISLLSKMEKANLELEKQIKEICNEKDSLVKENSIFKEKLSQITENYTENMKCYDTLNTSHRSLKDSHAKLKCVYEDVTKKQERFFNEIHLFFISCCTKLKETFHDIEIGEIISNSNDYDMKYSSSEKILYFLDLLSNEYKKLLTYERESFEREKMNLIQIQNLNDEKNELISKIERLSLTKDEEIKSIEIFKSEEIQRQREMFYEKIKSLTSLLEESNKMILVYETDNKELKAKIAKLEYHLRMLTNSHMELEQSIGDNNSTLQNAFEEKEVKCNSLLREIELKDLQIQSLEKLLLKQEEPQGEVSLAKETTMSSHENIFVRNEENENELKKLMQNYTSQEEDTMNVVNTESKVSNEQGTNNSLLLRSQKTPGKIYAIKRK